MAPASSAQSDGSASKRKAADIKLPQEIAPKAARISNWLNPAGGKPNDSIDVSSEANTQVPPAQRDWPKKVPPCPSVWTASSMPELADVPATLELGSQGTSSAPTLELGSVVGAVVGGETGSATKFQEDCVGAKLTEANLT